MYTIETQVLEIFSFITAFSDVFRLYVVGILTFAVLVVLILKLSGNQAYLGLLRGVVLCFSVVVFVPLVMRTIIAVFT
jgi:hypothetical protein